MRIVILDGYTVNPGDLSWSEIEKEGDLVYYDRTDKDNEREIIERIGESKIVITNKTPISKNVIQSCPNIKYIALLSTGYNVVDTDYAKEKGIKVSNVPTYGTDSVAQYTIALLLEICHHIGHHSRQVMEGRWEKSIDWCFWDYPLIELSGKTFAVFGFGRIGRRTAEIAKALGMKVLVYSRTIRNDGWNYVSKEELFSSADIISLHAPLNQETKEIINKDTIKMMKDGVILINTSRGGLINEEDLCRGLDEGKIAYAALDVVSTEPIKGDNPLLKAKNCIITPHMAWGAKEARERIIAITADNIRAFKAGTPINLVN